MSFQSNISTQIYIQQHSKVAQAQTSISRPTYTIVWLSNHLQDNSFTNTVHIHFTFTSNYVKNSTTSTIFNFNLLLQERRGTESIPSCQSIKQLHYGFRYHPDCCGHFPDTLEINTFINQQFPYSHFKPENKKSK